MILIILIKLFLYIGVVISATTYLQWHIDKPYIYNGFIYRDSKTVVINPAIQIKIQNNEEICNFYVNKSKESEKRSSPFRVVVKSAALGLGELELSSIESLDEWKNEVITFHIIAEACHDPDNWSPPALVRIKVLDPPEPIWRKESYKIVINNNISVGTTVVRVAAYLPKRTNPNNIICKYLIKSPIKSPFHIDGEGAIKTTEKLSNSETVYMTLVVVAEDCSQPKHRNSQVKIAVTIDPSCIFGWAGFNKVINYTTGSGIKFLGQHPRFQMCENEEIMTHQRPQTLNTNIKLCISNRTLRLTTSVELKSQPGTSKEGKLGSRNNCKLDFKSLDLQREVCGISKSETVELLSDLDRLAKGVVKFPLQINIFPASSTMLDYTFSFYFWMKRDTVMGDSEDYIFCQVDESGNNIFSVSLKKCILRVQLASYKGKYSFLTEDQSIPSVWDFNLPILCDEEWHHIVVLATRASQNLRYPELTLFIDGELLEYKRDNPEISLNGPLQHPISNLTDIFIGQCPKVERTEFKGLLAGVIMAPGVLLKSSISRCLSKCSERLYFTEMNQMNPGMSVSLNSEMQMIIINGHNIDEVVRLVRAIGFVNPTSDPRAEMKNIVIETEMSCGARVYNVPPVKVVIQVHKPEAEKDYVQMLTQINLISTVSSILIPDSTETNSDTGVGVAVFANTTIVVTTVPKSTYHRRYDEASVTISKCVIKIHPKMNAHEYIDWPRQFIESVSLEKYSIHVRNDSKTVVLRGLHNRQVYQFILQHMRYFSPTTATSPTQASRRFSLQCYLTARQSIIKSNHVSVKVTIWYNNYGHYERTPASNTHDDITRDYLNSPKAVIDNITVAMNDVPLHAESNAVIIPEIETYPQKKNVVAFNVLLGIGLLTLISVIITIIQKYRKNNQGKEGLPFQVIDSMCFPVQLIKERMKSSPSVHVELSKDFINYASEGRRRNISMEMQWDDAELKSNFGFNIIGNPCYEVSTGDIDNININKDVPPACELEDSSTDDDSYGEFSDGLFAKVAI